MNNSEAIDCFRPKFLPLHVDASALLFLCRPLCAAAEDLLRFTECPPPPSCCAIACSCSNTSTSSPCFCTANCCCSCFASKPVKLLDWGNAVAGLCFSSPLPAAGVIVPKAPAVVPRRPARYFCCPAGGGDIAVGGGGDSIITILEWGGGGGGIGFGT